MSMSQTDKLLREISSKLDKVLRLLALDVVKGYEKELEKIEILDSLGFRPVEIARLLNKTQNNVNRRLAGIRKKRKQSENAENESNNSEATLNEGNYKK